MKPIERLIFMYGNASKAARALDIPRRQIVEGWVKSGFIPYKMASRVQKKTGKAITKIQVWEAADEARGIE